ncbi:paraquat-inducible protein B [Endobacter medicaginis]|jgi:paraquat-inducible protein B|uniref:MCE family protein n=1 Tax=Endobacter medicaginis TaxID=1181271 RepID=A0A839V058_9PROT|nr:MlaD family protein [Endobacter medicaginis]MBB3173022.1 paraquat-inducible protein B [Endobacter medicaginis]MCX5475199.1 MlaD family protein [Endobacter medicaginis]NVN30324.1 MCE family protein [Endobacter medicaginis]
MTDPPAGSDLPEAKTRRTRFSIVWLLPIIVGVIAVWLAWQQLSRRGPLVTITFQTADGLTSGQTEVKHKAVSLGTVESIKLADDLKSVVVRVRMTDEAVPLLTDHARFWVVRPRLSGASVSGLETLLSGAYISVDPGDPGGTYTTSFKGLETPPGVRSDEPGRTYTLMAGSVGSISEGSPVFFRDVVVGEVLGYKMPPGGRGPIPVSIFVRDPYDTYLRTDSRFWDVSGVRFVAGPTGFHVQLESLQAAISGGVAFGLPKRRRSMDAPEAPDNSSFKLYDSEDDADAAGYTERIPAITYISSSVKGLAAGSPVTMFGITVGEVQDTRLIVDAKAGTARVRVNFEIQPERVDLDNKEKPFDRVAAARAMVHNGLRASVDSQNFLTGSSMISLGFVPNAEPEEATVENGVIVIPSHAGGLAGITETVSAIASKIEAMPLTQIGEHLNDLLANASATIGGPEVKQSLRDLQKTLASVQHLANNADRKMQPFLDRLPAMSDQLQQTLTRVNGTVGAYGGDSDFQRNLQQTLGQLNDTARAIRLLVDYLNRHPSSLITGRHP